jgi:NAD(P)H-hydrate epimerase
MNLDGFPAISRESVAWITESQMVEVDRVMIEDLDIGLIQMMENAGRNLARVAVDVFEPSVVSVVVGSGGNGGGGLVAARHLMNAGVAVVVTSTRSKSEMHGVPARQFEILDRMGVDVADDPAEADVTIDAIIGYSLRGAPRGRSADLIECMNLRSNVVSLDVPSGLDATLGVAPGVAVSSDVTMTLALPKVGLRDNPVVGELLLADISVPRFVTSSLARRPLISVYIRFCE